MKYLLFHYTILFILTKNCIPSCAVIQCVQSECRYDDFWLDFYLEKKKYIVYEFQLPSRKTQSRKAERSKKGKESGEYNVLSVGSVCLL